MSHYDDTERENWHESLRYDTHGFWFAHVGATYIQVPGVIYERLLTAYLQSHGLTRKTYIQIFGEAESIWLKQVSLESETLSARYFPFGDQASAPITFARKEVFSSCYIFRFHTTYSIEAQLF